MKIVQPPLHVTWLTCQSQWPVTDNTPPYLLTTGMEGDAGVITGIDQPFGVIWENLDLMG